MTWKNSPPPHWWGKYGTIYIPGRHTCNILRKTRIAWSRNVWYWGWPTITSKLSLNSCTAFNLFSSFDCIKINVHLDQGFIQNFFGVQNQPHFFEHPICQIKYSINFIIFLLKICQIQNFIFKNLPNSEFYCWNLPKFTMLSLEICQIPKKEPHFLYPRRSPDLDKLPILAINNNLYIYIYTIQGVIEKICKSVWLHLNKV